MSNSMARKEDLTLGNTVSMMLSDDYKERFKAEYLQTFIRYRKLSDILCESRKGELAFDLNCDIDLLEIQFEAMSTYLTILQTRAKIEEINI